MAATGLNEANILACHQDLLPLVFLRSLEGILRTNKAAGCLFGPQKVEKTSLLVVNENRK